ncbi:MAG: hypothetical protein ACKO5C_06640 [Ferruginibacter sp.]
MNKLVCSLSFVLFFLISACSESDHTSPKERNKATADTVTSVDDAVSAPDTNQIVYPDITVLAYERTDILYDTEGWPVEPGTVRVIKDFQKNKVYRLKKASDYLQKLEISGQSEQITIQFFDGDRNRLHEEKNITLNGKKIYTSSDPFGHHNAGYQEWMHGTIAIKILFKEAVIFEGLIIKK